MTETSKYAGLLRNWHRPRWWAETVLPYVREHYVREPVLSAMATSYARFGGDGCDVMSEDWDNLVVLDACRYDAFEESNTIPGTLSSRRSRGSATVEFLEENFDGGRFHDTVYVNAHPNVTLHLDGSFHDRVDVWRDGWSQELHTVPPAAVTEAAIRARRTYPRKRLIVHYLQPHCPFIGDWARAHMEDQAGIEYTKSRVLGEDPAEDGSYYAWDQVRRGLVSVDTVRRAYRENLEIVLPHVEELVEEIDGKSVVTSDHGNLFGEYVLPFPMKVYEHPPGIRAENLVKVPWLTVDGSSRIEVVSEPPVDETTTSRDSAQLDDHLRHLGYADRAN